MPGESVWRKSKFLINEKDLKPNSTNSFMFSDMIWYDMIWSRRRLGQLFFKSMLMVQLILRRWSHHSQGRSLPLCSSRNFQLKLIRNFQLKRRLQDSRYKDGRNIWPIESVWDIVKDWVVQKNCTNARQLRNAIFQAWREIDQNKALCRRVMAALPKKLEAVINKHGSQILKEDYWISYTHILSTK